MKKRLSLFLVFVLILGCITPNLSYADSYEEEYAVNLTAQIFDVNNELAKYGLSLEDFKDLPDRDPQFYEDIRNHFLNTTTPATLNLAKDTQKMSSSIFTNNDTQPSLESKFKAERWAYAREMALLNMKRDNQAKDEKSEITYMYLSHFIDRPNIIKYIDKSMSDGDPYYTAWITNEDRNSYNYYLNGSKTGNIVKKGASFATDIFSLVKSLPDSSLYESLSVFKSSLFLIGVRRSTQSVSDSTRELIVAIKTASNSQEAIDRIEETLSFKRSHISDFFKNKFDLSLDLIIGAKTAGICGFELALLTNLAVGAVNIWVDVFEIYWWKALVATLNGRAALRGERYRAGH